ncbi:hypothetical protein KSC_005010 [Ktedonobacter sp. SOSP1-52]|nr:hypothetical protein KSC_005010 [Ktedonobacter sp. SOSP1-52]
MPTVSRICPELFKEWKERGKTDKQASGTFTVMEIGWGDVTTPHGSSRGLLRRLALPDGSVRANDF